jgi:hypothetical protein
MRSYAQDNQAAVRGTYASVSIAVSIFAPWPPKMLIAFIFNEIMI